MDAVTLVAATAFGLAGLSASVGGLSELGEELRESLSSFGSPANGWVIWSWVIYSGYGFLMTAVFAFCWAWTLAVLMLRLRRPRPQLRDLACQPGAMACFAAALALVPALVGLLFLLLSSGSPRTVDYNAPGFQRGLAAFFILLPALSGFSVLGAWTTLFLTRQYRAEPTWIDRTGRVLGVYWIGSILLPLWGLC
jgi:hypothetical protein